MFFFIGGSPTRGCSVCSTLPPSTPHSYYVGGRRRPSIPWWGVVSPITGNFWRYLQSDFKNILYYFLRFLLFFHSSLSWISFLLAFLQVHTGHSIQPKNIKSLWVSFPSSAAMAPLNILTLNVQGLNIPQKRTKAFRSFHANKAHIVCLQETHFTTTSTPKFVSSFYPQVFSASATTKQRGTLIAFHRTTPFTLHSEIKDPEGRYLILLGHIMDTEITIVSWKMIKK